LVRALEEDDEAGGLGGVGEVKGAGGVETNELADDGDVGELAARVFAAGDGGGSGVGGESGVEGDVLGDDDLDLPAEASAGTGEMGEDEGRLGLAGQFCGQCGDAAAIVADELGLAVDDHLGGIDAIEGEAAAVVLLAGGEGGGGVGIFPAEAVPIVDVLAEDEELDAGDGLLVELGEDSVGRGGNWSIPER